MPEPWSSGISPAQENRIKRAVEGRCELCQEYTPISLLELHGFPFRESSRRMTPRERERHILVVCGPCHILIHDLPVPIQKIRSRVMSRAFATRQAILKALGHIPKKVIPPDDQDFAKIYDDTIREFSGHYR